MIIDALDKDGKIIKLDVDKTDDYSALQYEKHQEIIKWCKDNNIEIVAFTVDSRNQSNGFWLVNQKAENWNKMYTTMDIMIKRLSGNSIGL